MLQNAAIPGWKVMCLKQSAVFIVWAPLIVQKTWRYF